MSLGCFNNQCLWFFWNDSSSYCLWYGPFLCTCNPHILNISCVSHFKYAKLLEDSVHQTLEKLIKKETLYLWSVHIVIDVSRFIHQPQIGIFQHLLLLQLLIERWRFCLVNIWSECWHFWQNWQVFKMSEVLGRLWFMDYISLFYGLHTILAIVLNWEGLQEKWEQPMHFHFSFSQGTFRRLRWELHFR